MTINGTTNLIKLVLVGIYDTMVLSGVLAATLNLYCAICVIFLSDICIFLI